MISQEFQFYRPTEFSDVLWLLGRDLGDVRVLAGGMTLVPAMNLGIARPDVIVSLNHVKSLDAIVVGGGSLRLGALVRHRRIETDDRIRAACPLLNEAAGLIAGRAGTSPWIGWRQLGARGPRSQLYTGYAGARRAIQAC